MHNREQNLQLANMNDKLAIEYRDLQADMRVAKSRLRELKAAKEQAENQLHDRDSQIRCMEMELSRLMARSSVCVFCDVFFIYLHTYVFIPVVHSVNFEHTAGRCLRVRSVTYDCTC